MRHMVEARAAGLCECCGDRAGQVVHHRKRRSQGGTNALANLMLLDGDCHRRIHDEPEWARSRGFLLRRSDPEAPFTYRGN